ncbi:hypothetical protein EWM64_g9225 [Hericium alpestre]|uniref:Fungal-type protein kinase domain-containing protein n=1 Tax=Hericium alpestre TaxID=135208 RepID=A0A4Y9ZL31_9AGAM|nr:hypothetical protein EWM64_g9225 [Hericium alpestre]
MSSDPPNPGSHVSPRKVFLGALENLSSDHDSERKFLKDELSGKVLYDDVRVFTRLKVDAYAATLDDAYVLKFSENHVDERDALDKLVSGAERQPSTRNKREVEMYPHLAVIFNDIIRDHRSAAQQNTTIRPPTRCFVKGHQLLPEEEHHTIGFPTVNPDFTITDDGPSGNGVRSSERMARLWRHRSAFVEVKPAKDQGPKPAGSKPDTIHDLVVQSADYARLHMSSRPFLLFSVGLLIFGSQFCVGIFDRGGVMLSPVYDMWEDIRLFIAVIRSLASVDSQDLGLDPSVRLLGDEDGIRLTGVDYPAHIIDPIGIDATTKWCTVGPPLWSSISLLGRGTVIWRVRKYLGQKLSDEEFVMKTAWRSSKRDKESDIYTSIKGHCAGLSRLVTGGDVLVHVGSKTERITVRYLRRESDDPQAETPVLHRLILTPVGRPLWDYRSDTELLQGLLDALEAHEFLWKQQILHRDVSAGNILLAQDADALGAAGFLHDIEFAHMPPDAELSTLEHVAPVTKYNDNLRPVGITEIAIRRRTTFQTQRGAALTFMAVELLQAAQWKQAIEHTPEHDIESFIWVLGYCVLRKLYSEAYAIKQSGYEYMSMRKRFSKAFGQLALDNIIENRNSGGPVRWCNAKEAGPMEPFFQDHISEPLRDLLQHYGEQALLRLFRDPAKNPDFETLTHHTMTSKFYNFVHTTV